MALRTAASLTLTRRANPRNDEVLATLLLSVIGAFPLVLCVPKYFISR
jgi:hypothetical protein